MYSICPIFPDRIIWLVSDGVLGAPKSVLGLRDEVLKKLYMNDALINAVYEGLAFKNKSKVIFPHKV